MYIELLEQDDMAMRGDKHEATGQGHVHHDGCPHIWSYEVRKDISRHGSRASVLPQSVSYHVDKKVFIVVHVSDVLCVGPWGRLDLPVESKTFYGLKNTMSRGATGRKVLQSGGPKKLRLVGTERIESSRYRTTWRRIAP